MAKVSGEWIVSNVSLRDSAKYLGFDLDCFDEQKNDDLKYDIKRYTINEAVARIDDDWSAKMPDKKLSNVSQGVYMIALSAPLGITYIAEEEVEESAADNEAQPVATETWETTSPIIYIGKGQIRQRLKAHLTNSLFDLSQSLHGVGFDFYMMELADGRSPFLPEDVEAELIGWFEEEYGEKPLLNKIAGSYGCVKHKIAAPLLKPLRNNKYCQWGLRPERTSPWYREWYDIVRNAA